MQSVRLQLNAPDFTTASRIAAVINRHLGSQAARALDPATVELSRPAGYNYDTVSLLTSIEQLSVQPDQPARIVIDDRSGVIVIGADVRISKAEIGRAHV